MLGQELWLLSPELVLLGAALVVLGLDTIRPHQQDKRWLPYATLVGLAGALAVTTVLWAQGWNEEVLGGFAVDAFALTVKMVALAAMMIVVLASDAYMRINSRHQGEFYALLLASTLAICLLGGASDLVLLFLAFDFLSITSYILTGFLRENARSAEAALKYFLYGAALSAVMLFGMSWLYGLTGATNLASIARVLLRDELALRPVALPALVMVAAGFGFKIGAVPFHQWAPDAYEGAPTPVTAFISVGPKVAGFAVILRVMLVVLPQEGLQLLDLDWRTLLMAIATFTMTVGNLVAIWQTNVKRLLAYSSIAQAGYILIGVVAASPRGVAAVLLYLGAYAVTNLGAFAVVIAFSNRTGSDEIEDYAGLSKRSPALALILILCLLSLGGIPPTAGFVGKLWLFSAALEKGLLWLAVVGVLNSVISLSYYWKLMRAMYLVPAKTDEPVAATPLLAAALGVTLAGVLLIGIFPGPLLELLQAAAQVFFAG